MTSHYTCGFVTTIHDFEGVLGGTLDTFFGLSQLHGHGSWLVCEVALSVHFSMFIARYDISIYVSIYTQRIPI